LSSFKDLSIRRDRQREVTLFLCYDNDFSVPWRTKCEYKRTYARRVFLQLLLENVVGRVAGAREQLGRDVVGRYGLAQLLHERVALYLHLASFAYNAAHLKHRVTIKTL
jgi:hypothetical protein